MEQEIICMGEICPLPLLKTIKKLEEMKEGDILKVVVDHRCSLDNIESYFYKKDYVQGSILKINEVLTGVWEIYIKK
ncbi:putative redox protein, regulator of disulfide bond formation [Thermoanaerobacter kivui]|uniref:Putative redox protein, regulator of disulfide bond formation n=1 Tax=Thermoanaerobacter kivui TaxID=2325 RepID=A0A097AN96_THEKI|nr:sulfurtransferase TusA family protein [Thermoanaerobacter kivui]AIS51289.1 putative redox protein, regulator of disulfide bond formation [Thermoanaerobacter kivui]